MAMVKRAFAEDILGAFTAADLLGNFDMVFGQKRIHCLQCNSIDNNKYRQILHNLCEPIDVFDEEKLSEDHVLILFDLNIIPMNENNLNYIRKTYPQLVYDYIRGDTPGYLKLSESAFLLEETITLLDWNSISDNQKIELLQYTNHPIKLTDHSYSDKLVITDLMKQLNKLTDDNIEVSDTVTVIWEI